ncbi:MAG TPA: hypothetical protein VK209_11595 [Candidatus Sulfotelmatobacter sp.]|nr:hypothetical protein [Candidatus Sulfotelmatobacter sp.]
MSKLWDLIRIAIERKGAGCPTRRYWTPKVTHGYSHFYHAVFIK